MCRVNAHFLIVSMIVDMVFSCVCQKRLQPVIPLPPWPALGLQGGAASLITREAEIDDGLGSLNTRDSGHLTESGNFSLRSSGHFRKSLKSTSPHRNREAPPFSNDGSIVVIHGCKGDTPDLPQRTRRHSDGILDMLASQKVTVI